MGAPIPMPIRLNPARAEELLNTMKSGGKVDITTGHTFVKQWLVINLTHTNRSFKIHKLGAGVERITTETDTCPCCKRALAK